MLSSISIKNYALIDHLMVGFSDGFTTITGETGAGKSILLGGLSLVLGKRADTTALKDDTQKCIIEAEFQIKNYKLQSFFNAYDLDYAKETLLRREILPSGKTRAFINDSPVTLDILKKLGASLVDIHSQHQTLQLGENAFQMRLLDALAGNFEALQSYKVQLEEYTKLEKELKELRDFQEQSDKEYDYQSFLLEELEKLDLREGMQQELELEQGQLDNAEQILETISKSHQMVVSEGSGVLAQLHEMRQLIQKISGFGSVYSALEERLQSMIIDIDDISTEFVSSQDDLEVNPERLSTVNSQLQLLYDLQKKHKVQSIEELVIVKEDLAHKVELGGNLNAKIEEKEEELTTCVAQLDQIAQQLHQKRQAVAPKLKSQLEEKLASLGMPSSSFQIELHLTENFNSTGKDDLSFLFSANKGANPGPLKKVASGGELSRIMLTIKSIMASYENLPTLMFDEIDSGVSGEISNRMGEIMQEMSQYMQIFTITHLPQVAAKGVRQFKVHKEEDQTGTITQIKLLSDSDRVLELAEMLGGKEISDSAVAHAKQLLMSV